MDKYDRTAVTAMNRDSELVVALPCQTFDSSPAYRPHARPSINLRNARHAITRPAR
jgi:hypothetical protein